MNSLVKFVGISLGMHRTVCFFRPGRLGIGFLLLAASVFPQTIHAQAPSLLWTNGGGRVFAVDGQTNVYAHNNGTVVKLSPSGSLSNTIVLSLLAGVAQRDSTNAYYFAGSLPSAGGNQYPYPTFFLAKYTSEGSIIWTNS